MVLMMAVIVVAGNVKMDSASLAVAKGLVAEKKTVEATAYALTLDMSTGVGGVEWLPVAVALENYYWAMAICEQAKDKIGQFKYAKLYLLGNYQELSNVVATLDRVGSINFEDTEITPEIQLKFLQAVNAKYLRFLTSATDCPWRPLITALQGQIKQMKEDMGLNK